MISIMGVRATHQKAHLEPAHLKTLTAQYSHRNMGKLHHLW
ncbi:MAG: hypothetical protein ACJAY2_000095 [Pseudomonadales bacterium]|jgi:hypothetical protein